MKQKLFLFTILMIATNLHAQRFSSVTLQGDTLYYTITSDSTVVLCPPCLADNTIGIAPPIYRDRNIPQSYIYVDTLIIPQTVLYNNITYTVTEIGENTFVGFGAGAEPLTYVQLPSTIKKINGPCFVYLLQLRNVNLPETIDTIESLAFWDCPSLNVNVPESINYVADLAFAHIDNYNYYGTLTNAINWAGTGGDPRTTWNGYNTVTGLLISNDTLFGANNRLYTSFTIPNNITHIYYFAFNSNNNITSIIIPQSVTGMDMMAFSDCHNLQIATINGSTIGSHAFSNCNSLINVTMTNNLRTIGEYAFRNCTSLGIISIPNSVVSLGYGTFYQCGGLNTLRLPDSLTTLPGDLLRDCSGLQSVHIGSLVTSINSQAFAGCTSLDSIYIDCIVPPTLGDNVFYDVPLNNVVLIVPCGTGNTYRNANGWSSFSNIIETECPRGTVLVFANDSALGAVSGSGTYLLGDTVTIAAFPTTHTYFNGWSNGVTVNPYTLIVTSDTSLTAIFQPADTTYIDVHDTTYVDVHDTTYIDVHDTTYVDVFVHDTTYIDVHDTTYVDVFVHDTTYVDVFVHDTTYIDVPYPVHDTTYVNVHDTTYVPVHDTTYVNVPYPVHDTTYINVPYPVHDTTYVNVPYPVHDTTYVNVPYPVHDTTVVTDTLWLTQYDTIWLHDTIIIHDTIYITQEGIGGAETVNAKVYSSHGQIVVEGATGNTVTLYDVSGRMLATKREDGSLLHFDVPSSGTYMIKIGDVPARKVVVIR